MLLAAGACALVIGAVAIFQLSRTLTVSGYAETRSELETLRDERRQLGRALHEAQSEVTTLREQLAYLERSREIDSAASRELRDNLLKLQAEVTELREQIAFYQVISSPDEARAGVRVLEGKLHPGDTPRRWTLELVLIQSLQRNREAAGSLELTLLGLDANGKEVSQPLAPLLLPDSRLGAYSFRYFQELEVRFELPSGFRPQKLAVALQPERGSRIVETLEWASLVSDASIPDAHAGETPEEDG